MACKDLRRGHPLLRESTKRLPDVLQRLPEPTPILQWLPRGFQRPPSGLPEAFWRRPRILTQKASQVPPGGSQSPLIPQRPPRGPQRPPRGLPEAFPEAGPFCRPEGLPDASRRVPEPTDTPEAFLRPSEAPQRSPRGLLEAARRSRASGRGDLCLNNVTSADSAHVVKRTTGNARTKSIHGSTKGHYTYYAAKSPGVQVYASRTRWTRRAGWITCSTPRYSASWLLGSRWLFWVVIGSRIDHAMFTCAWIASQ